MLLFLDRFAAFIAVVAVVIASARIVATYAVFNHTSDEPGHFVCGMGYLAGHICPYEYAPLPRALIAIGPYLAGARRHYIAPTNESLPRAGLDVLYDNYDLYLALARLGNLPFFWLAGGVIYFWGKRYFGKPAAAIAVLVFSLLPPILAHAGLATTDMALTAFLSAAFLSALIWAEHPTTRNSLAFGALMGLAVLSKFSTCGFLPAALGFSLIAYMAAARAGLNPFPALVRERVRPLCLALLTAAFAVWMGYQFSVGPFPRLPFRIPAPQFFSALKFIANTNGTGLPAYLLGEYSDTGFWYYYPVALAVKTPLPFLLLLLLGLIRRRADSLAVCPPLLFPLAFSLSILIVGAFSQVNIGIRHVLPVYAGFSILAANGAVALLERAQKASWIIWVPAVLLGWLTWTGAAKHPDYIAYFNEFVGKEPESVLVDSDLDWGQDLKRLSRRLHELGAKEVRFDSFIAADLEKQHGFPHVISINPTAQSPGWTAVSPTWWKLLRFDMNIAYRGAPFWIDDTQPTERVGSILLYYRRPPL